MTNEEDNVIDFMKYHKRENNEEANSSNPTIADVVNISIEIEKQELQKEAEKATKLYEDIIQLVSYISGKTDNNIAKRRLDYINKRAKGLSDSEKADFYDEQYDVLTNDMEMMFQEETYRLRAIMTGNTVYFTLKELHENGLTGGGMSLEVLTEFIGSVEASTHSLEYRLHRGEIDSADYSAFLTRIENLPGVVKTKLEDTEGQDRSYAEKLTTAVEDTYFKLRCYSDECKINYGMSLEQLSGVMDCLEYAVDDIGHRLATGKLDKGEFDGFINRLNALPSKVNQDRKEYESTLGSYYAVS